MKAYLTRFNYLSDAVCNVDYLCHRGCSMSPTLHESCSITLALRSLGFPGRRGIHFWLVIFPLMFRSRRRRAPVPADLPAEQKGCSFSAQSDKCCGHPLLSSCRSPERAEVGRLVLKKRKEKKKQLCDGFSGWAVWLLVQGDSCDIVASLFFSG